MPSAKSTQQPEGLSGPARWFGGKVWVVALAIGCLRLFYLAADFPNFSRWSLDQAKYTDEGWWAGAAITQHLLGHWYMPGDYNPAVAVPVWPMFLGIIFHFTGVSILVARALSVFLSLATLGIVFLVAKRYARPDSESAANLSVVLLAASPFAFVFSRLAILDTFVVFQFSVLLLVASYASIRRVFLLAILVPVLLLTKTTAAVLLPAVAWLAWTSLRRTRGWKTSAAALAGVAAISALILKAYVATVFRRGFGEDYRYFFDINQVEEIDWRHTLSTVADLLRACLWVDRILYPAAVVVVVLACVRLRELWRNPLFTACCTAFAGEAAYIFIRQENYAPRYFLPMLIPVAVILSLGVQEIRAIAPRMYLYCMIPIAAAVLIDVATIAGFLHHRSYQLYGASKSIEAIIRADKDGNHMLLGVSGSEISLITGLPAINDVYGTDSLERRIARYHPGWYVAWIGIGPDEQKLLSAYSTIREVAAYPVFDDDERNRLILYKLSRR